MDKIIVVYSRIIADCFISSPSQNIFVSSLLSSVKRRNMLWEIEHKSYCLLLTWMSVWDYVPYFHSSVSNVNFILWKRGGGAEIYPACPDVDSMCCMCNYRNIFIIGRWNLLKYILLLLLFFGGFETYRLIGR